VLCRPARRPLPPGLARRPRELRALLPPPVDLIVGLRLPEEQEREGLDQNEHGERAYTT
jgi:hypothetical protein